MNHLSAKYVGETSVWRLPEVNDGGEGTSVRTFLSPNISEVFVDAIILGGDLPKSKIDFCFNAKSAVKSEKL